jgi:DNA-binding beta-propeller fold protein YncE
MSGLDSDSHRSGWRLLGLAVATAVALLAFAASATHAAPFVYVVNGADDNLSQYQIGPGGRLAPLDPPTVATGHNPALVTVSPDGRSVYATNVGLLIDSPDDYNSAIYQYDLGADGTLSPKSPEMVLGCGSFRNHIALSPDGRNAYVTTWSDCGTVHQYDIDADGKLSPKSPPYLDVGGFGDPTGLAVSPDGKSVYVANTGDGRIYQYDAGGGGELSPKRPPSVAAGTGPFGVAVSPDGQSVYVTNTTSDGRVYQFDVGRGGALTPKSRGTVPAGVHPYYLAVSPDGKSAYVVNAGEYPSHGNVSQYDVGPGGALSPKTPRTVAAGNYPAQIAVSPNGESVYVTSGEYDEDGGVFQFDVGAGGRLIAKDPESVAAGEWVKGIAVSPAPLPTAKEECRDGGWSHYGFRNQGRCIRFVKNKARQRCRAERAEIGHDAFREKYGNPNHHHRRPFRRCVQHAIAR